MPNENGVVDIINHKVRQMNTYDQTRDKININSATFNRGWGFDYITDPSMLCFLSNMDI